MKLDLFESFKHSDSVELSCRPVKLDLTGIEEYSFDDDVTVVCRLLSNGDIARIEGEVRTRVTLECSRCLEVFTREIRGDFSIVAKKLRKGEAPPRHSGEDIRDEDIDLVIIDNDTNEIDITEFVRDAVLLAIPLKPVCDEGCKGLCSVCGQNLNEGDCGCRRERVDSRWKTLSGLFGS